MRIWLKELRLSHGQTTSEAAAALGLSQPYYSLIESGKRQQRLELPLAARIAEQYSITVEEILHLDGTI